MKNFYLSEATGKIISGLTRVEAHSAVRRLHRDNYLTSVQTERILSGIDVETDSLITQAVDDAVLSVAVGLMKRNSVRALDALQLASAVVARTQSYPEDVRFVAADQALLRAAEAEGFLVWDPSASDG